MKKYYAHKKETLVQKNLNLIDFVIRKYYSWTGLEKNKQQSKVVFYLTYNDIYSEGVIGLIKATKKWKTFKKKKRMSFTTFAVWYIRSSIRVAIFKTGMSIVKIPRHVFRRKRKIDNAIAKNNLTYLDLYNQGKIPLSAFEDLNCINNGMLPMTIEDCVIEGNDVDNTAYDNIINPVLNRDLKLCARKILWKVIKQLYVQHRKRNYTIVLLKLGLLPNQNQISFQRVEYYLNKKQNKRLSQSSLRKIYSVVIPKFRTALKLMLNKEGELNEY